MRMCLARRKMGRLESAITSFPNRTNKIKPVLIVHPWFSTSEDVFQTLIQVLKEQKDDYCHRMWWNSPIKYSTLRATLRFNVFWFKPVKAPVKLCLHHDRRKSSWHFNVAVTFIRKIYLRWGSRWNGRSRMRWGWLCGRSRWWLCGLRCDRESRVVVQAAYLDKLEKIKTFKCE